MESKLETKVRPFKVKDSDSVVVGRNFENAIRIFKNQFLASGLIGRLKSRRSYPSVQGRRRAKRKYSEYKLSRKSNGNGKKR